MWSSVCKSVCLWVLVHLCVFMCMTLNVCEYVRIFAYCMRISAFICVFVYMCVRTCECVFMCERFREYNETVHELISYMRLLL